MPESGGAGAGLPVRKGIVLAGGTGTRLHPLTLSTSKQLLPVYDKPLIYYPLTTLMLAGIRDILIITTPRDRLAFESLLGDGSQWGLRISYAIQAEPKGLPEAFTLGADFIGTSPVCLILGDNVFYSAGLQRLLSQVSVEAGAHIFGYFVRDASPYGVVRFDDGMVIRSIEEKPVGVGAGYAITGMYFFDPDVVDITAGLVPSARGELEITDVLRAYLEQDRLSLRLFSRGTAWLDTGTPEALMDAGNFVRIVEERQDLKIACPEEVAFRMGYIDAAALQGLATPLLQSGYGEYLLRLLDVGKP